MFGPYYQRYDTMLAEKNELMMGGRYTAEILAELLNRANVLDSVYTMVREYDPRRNKADPEYVERLERLAAAVAAFGRDVEEATIRGRRARLFTPDEWGILDTAIAAGGLEEIGGPLSDDD